MNNFIFITTTLVSLQNLFVRWSLVMNVLVSVVQRNRRQNDRTPETEKQKDREKEGENQRDRSCLSVTLPRRYSPIFVRLILNELTSPSCWSRDASPLSLYPWEPARKSFLLYYDSQTKKYSQPQWSFYIRSMLYSYTNFLLVGCFTQ